MTELPTQAELANVCQFVRRFVLKRRQARWQTGLEGKPSKWSRLDMDDLFQIAEDIGSVKQTEIDKELEAPDLAGNPMAMLFRFSVAPYFLRGCVRDLVNEVVEDDALVLAHRGEVMHASHHSSGWIVCRFP